MKTWRERLGDERGVALPLAMILLMILTLMTITFMTLGAALSILGTNNNTILFGARYAYAMSRDGFGPAALSRVHPAWRTPHVALIAQGVAGTLIFLSSLFLTIGGGTTTVQESYDILVNLTIVVYFVPYVFLFWGLTRLLKGAELTLGLRLAAIAGLLATVISMVLVFVPPAGTANVLNYEVNVVWQMAAVVAGGVGLYWFGRRRGAR